MSSIILLLLLLCISHPLLLKTGLVFPLNHLSIACFSHYSSEEKREKNSPLPHCSNRNKFVTVHGFKVTYLDTSVQYSMLHSSLPPSIFYSSSTASLFFPSFLLCSLPHCQHADCMFLGANTGIFVHVA